MTDTNRVDWCSFFPITDKQRRLRLVLSGAIEGMNYDKIRVAEPKAGVSLLAHAWSRSRTTYLLCAASSTTTINAGSSGGGSSGAFVYEITREASRHRRLLSPPHYGQQQQLQAINFVRDGDALAMGFESCFVVYNIWAKGAVNGEFLLACAV